MTKKPYKAAISCLIAFLLVGGLFVAKAQPGKALEFDGTDDYVNVPDDPSLRQATFTLEAWFNTSGGNDDIMTIINRQISGASPYYKRNYWLVVDNGNGFTGSSAGAVSFRLGDGSSILFTLSTSNANSTDYRDGNWHHVAVVVDDGNGNAKMFVDGTSVHSLTFSSNSVWTNSAPLQIGKSVGGSRHFQGHIDEVRLWSTVRTLSEIKEYMHQVIETPSNFSSLKGYWKMDDGSPSSKTTDATGNNNNGTLQNGPGWVTSEAVLTDATSKLHTDNAYSNDLAAIWPVINTASSGGLQITPNSSNSFSTSDDVVFGHNGGAGEDKNPSSSYASGADYSGATTVESRLNREWYIDDNAGSKTVDFVFTTSEAGTGDFGSYALVSDYVLIEVQSSGDDVIVQSASSASNGSNSTITFTNVDVNSTYTVGTTNESGSPLPVELISFEVKNVQRTALIAWSTASEIQNRHFLIQKMDQDWWKTIGRVKGHGTTTAPQKYEYTDLIPRKGANYYRIQQVDFDGSFEYSDVKAVHFGEQSSSGALQVFLLGNPVNRILNLNLSNNQGGSYRYHLYNSEGSPVKQGEWQLFRGNHSLNIPMNGLNAGTYVLSINGEDQQITKKVLKQ